MNKAMTDFSESIVEMDLMDLELKGGKYTWEKGERQDIATRLDRFLISEDLDRCFRNIKQSIMQSVTSDHSPIMLQCGDWGLLILISNSRRSCA